MVNAHKPSRNSFSLLISAPSCSLSLFFEARKLLARARIVFVHPISSLGRGREKRESATNCATVIVRSRAQSCKFLSPRRLES